MTYDQATMSTVRDSPISPIGLHISKDLVRPLCYFYIARLFSIKPLALSVSARILWLCSLASYCKSTILQYNKFYSSHITNKTWARCSHQCSGSPTVHVEGRPCVCSSGERGIGLMQELWGKKASVIDVSLDCLCDDHSNPRRVHYYSIYFVSHKFFIKKFLSIVSFTLSYRLNHGKSSSSSSKLIFDQNIHKRWKCS